MCIPLLVLGAFLACSEANEERGGLDAETAEYLFVVNFELRRGGNDIGRRINLSYPCVVELTIDPATGELASIEIREGCGDEAVREALVRQLTGVVHRLPTPNRGARVLDGQQLVIEFQER